MKIVYSPDYVLDFGDAHVFPVEKYRLVYEEIRAFVDADAFVTPTPATDEDILCVHDFNYVQKLRTGMLSEGELRAAEVPFSPALVDAFWLATGGTLLAGELAHEEGRAMNLSGGFHHAFPDHAEGFCLVNDVAVAIRVLQQRRKIEKAMAIDCDVHHGNGTAFIFGQDPSVTTISLHQANNYPAVKPPSDIDVHLRDGCTDAEYVRELERALAAGFNAASPDLVFYLAGADPYRQDMLGGLGLTIEGLANRDRIVLGACTDHGVACAVVLAGGYARDTNDTVTIHANTVRVARETALPSPNPPGSGCSK